MNWFWPPFPDYDALALPEDDEDLANLLAVCGAVHAAEQERRADAEWVAELWWVA